MSGHFFAVGAHEFSQACLLGMNPAVAFLVMARGTLRDNKTTSWSAQAIYKYSGIARRRGKTAIAELINAGLVKAIKEGNRPKYELHKPEKYEDLIWLPNTLTDGAGREIPPIPKLREYGSLKLLEMFILLYSEQELESDGGIPRTIARTEFVREKIGEIGPFTLYGFHRHSMTSNPVGLFSEFDNEEDDEGYRGASTILQPLIKLGLLREALYMADSNKQEAELLYPVCEETNAAFDTLWDWAEAENMYGILDGREEFQYFGIAPNHVKKASIVGCLRLHYRPHTSKTSRWWAMEKSQIEAMVGLINHTCQSRQHLKCAHQG